MDLYFIKSAARFTFLNMEYSGDDSRGRTSRASQFPVHLKALSHVKKSFLQEELNPDSI